MTAIGEQLLSRLRSLALPPVFVAAMVLSVLAIGAPAGGADGGPGGCDPHQPDTCTLAELADRLGMRIGTSAEHFEVTPGPYADTLAREFNAVTPENALKLYSTQATRGVWTFAHADAVVDFAETNGLEVRGHTLVWSQDQYPPQWIKDITDPDELRAVLVEHIETVMGHYHGRINRWDVVNEPLATLGTGPADSVIVRLLGPGTDWIAEQFATAHRVDPDAELWLNEFGTDLIPGKHEALLELVAALVADGVPVHGVGLQMHRFTVDGPDPAVLLQHLEDFAALGLEVAITELDVATRPDDPLAFERQAEAYGRVVGVCLAVPACNEVTTWNLSDADSWLDRLFGYPTRPTLFDDSFNPKPAYHTVRQLLADAVLELPVPPGPCDPDGTAPFTDVAADHPFCASIAWTVAAGLTTGYGDGTFRPDVAVSRQAAAAFLYRLAGSPPGSSEEPTFADVGLDHPFFAAVQWMASEGISTGYDDGTFRPGEPVSRQAAAVFLYRHAGEPVVVDAEVSFADVDGDHPFFAAIEWMADAGLATGTARPDGSVDYEPTSMVSRQAAAAFLERYATHPAG